MVRFWVSLEVLKARLRRLREERGAIDDLLMRGLFVVAVLGIAAGVNGHADGPPSAPPMVAAPVGSKAPARSVSEAYTGISGREMTTRIGAVR